MVNPRYHPNQQNKAILHPGPNHGGSPRSTERGHRAPSRHLHPCIVLHVVVDWDGTTPHHMANLWLLCTKTKKNRYILLVGWQYFFHKFCSQNMQDELAVNDPWNLGLIPGTSKRSSRANPTWPEGILGRLFFVLALGFLACPQ